MTSEISFCVPQVVLVPQFENPCLKVLIIKQINKLTYYCQSIRADS